jgi:hypothetical protein
MTRFFYNQGNTKPMTKLQRVGVPFLGDVWGVIDT